VNLETWGLDHLQTKFDKEIHMPGFLDRHDINPKLRSRMIDWMVEVFSAFKSQRAAFFLASQLFDTYLFKSKEPVDPKQVHLLGLTCMYIASKMEDIRPLGMKQVTKAIGHKQFGWQEVKDMEFDLLSSFKWKVGLITSLDFLVYFGQRIHSEFKSESRSMQIKKVEERACILAILAQEHYAMTSFRPSERACASYLVAVDQLLEEEEGLVQSHYQRIRQTVSYHLTIVRDNNLKRFLPQCCDGPVQSKAHRMRQISRGTTSRLPERFQLRNLMIILGLLFLPEALSPVSQPPSQGQSL